MISTVLMLGLRTSVNSKKILQEILKMQLMSHSVGMKRLNIL